MEQTNKKKIFIGSSNEADKYLQQAYEVLGDEFEVITWKHPSVFTNNQSTLDSLIKQSYLVDFALFLVTRDDVTKSRGEELPSPRDNVIFEFGMYLQSLGKDRCFMLVEKGTKVLSDMKGISFPQFDPQQPSNDFKSTLLSLKQNLSEAKRHIPSLVTTGLAYGYFDIFVKPLASWGECQGLTIQVRKSQFDESSYQEFKKSSPPVLPASLPALPVRAAFAEKDNVELFVDYPTTLNVIDKIIADKSELKEAEKEIYRNREIDNFQIVIERLMEHEPFRDKVRFLRDKKSS